MMRFSILAVGKIREQWIADGVNEYRKRLRRFCRLDIIEVPACRIPSNASSLEISEAVKQEGEKLLSNWKSGFWALAMAPRGKAVDSVELAGLLDKSALNGINHIAFVIGGSHGLSKEVCQQCRQILSFGPNTFPHQLFRVILLEQLYRAKKICAGEVYHK